MRARYYLREEAAKRGWKLAHPSQAGHALEEQEIMAAFPEIGLALTKPDFLFTVGGEPSVVIECKNDPDKIDDAISEARSYADTINETNRYRIRVAVGVAGGYDLGASIKTLFLTENGWQPLTSHGQELTTVPSVREVELAYEAGDATTSITVPSTSDFTEAAIDVSQILRDAKVEAPLRPKVLGAVIVSLYQGEVKTQAEEALASINELVAAAIESATELRNEHKDKLTDALRLSGADFDRLAPSIRRIVAILKRLNIRSVLHTDVDFLGLFYEAFLRYGYDNNALGIVFTPRHITRFCVALIGASPNDRVIDIACGTGGFLVAAYDRMIESARLISPAAVQQVKNSLYGLDTNPTVWSLASLNMFFRGDGKSHIEYASCFDRDRQTTNSGQFTRAFLNPPFSQQGEPERDFIDAAMDTLRVGGICAVVVKAGIFADDEHTNWRREFLRKHSVLAVISLPEDLFYPTAAPTSILVAEAHHPQSDDGKALMARVWNDGFEKLKNRRVERQGNELPEVQRCFEAMLAAQNVRSSLATVVTGIQIGDGEEWSPQQWLPEPPRSHEESSKLEEDVSTSLFKAVAAMPELVDVAIKDFTHVWHDKPVLPLGRRDSVNYFFTVSNGKSAGEKHYRDGTYPYISSGDATNSIIRLVDEVEGELFEHGCITVTAFGQASIQPWPLLARGNGGSSVRILIPRFKMSYEDLLWFASQINAQRWRFFYARMAIKGRIERLSVSSPAAHRLPGEETIAKRLDRFRKFFNELSSVTRH